MKDRPLRTRWYATPKGGSYHAGPNCPALDDVPVERLRSLTRAEVQASRLLPCGRCRPGYLRSVR